MNTITKCDIQLPHKFYAEITTVMLPDPFHIYTYWMVILNYNERFEAKNSIDEHN